jgi:hypothetical protein
MSSVLDPGALRMLEDDLGRTAARDFAGRYLAELPARIARLHRAVRDGDIEEGYAAALSLSSTSGMVGAVVVARFPRGFAAAARHGLGWPAARALGDLAAAARVTCTELNATLSTPTPPSPVVSRLPG